jgi:hypothetical protein
METLNRKKMKIYNLGRNYLDENLGERKSEVDFK